MSIKILMSCRGVCQCPRDMGRRQILPDGMGGIIAAAQVADALQNAIPFTARFRGTNALCGTLDALFIDCQMEWEDIFAGRLDEAEIIKRGIKMMTLCAMTPT